MEELVELNKSSEEQLSALICTLDDNPVLNVGKTHIEEVSYNGINYFYDSDDFRESIDLIYFDFIEDIRTFIQQNELSEEFHIDIASTLNNLLIKYQNARRQIILSPLRNEWKKLSQSFLLPYPPQSYDYKGEEKLFRNAYDFFYRMSSIQLEFIEGVISYLTSELQPYKDYVQYILPANNVKSEDLSLPIYFFKLTKESSKKSHLILAKIHKELKRIGYLDCTLPEFKKLFINYTSTKPTSSLPPIIWKCEHYNHLAYFIKCLTSTKIITPTKHPSTYQVALKLFNDRESDQFYHPNKNQYDFNLNPKDRAKFKSIVDKALMNSR